MSIDEELHDLRVLCLERKDRIVALEAELAQAAKQNAYLHIQFAFDPNNDDRLVKAVGRVEELEADLAEEARQADEAVDAFRKRLEEAEAEVAARDRMLRWVFENFHEVMPELDWREWLVAVRARAEEGGRDGN